MFQSTNEKNKSSFVQVSTILLCVIVFTISFAATKLSIRESVKSGQTSRDFTSTAFSNPRGDLSKQELQFFIKGKLLFHGVSNDNRPAEQRGIGPEFRAMSCGECHVNGGRGDPKVSPSIVKKISTIDENQDQFIAPSIIGMGFIEKIPDSFFAQHADPKDLNRDGISGRIPYSKTKDSSKIGRLGWQSDQASVRDQTLKASFEELGLSNSNFFGSKCNGQVNCTTFPEMTPEQEKAIIFYTQNIEVPKSRPLNSASKQGQRLFNSLGCSSCHIPTILISEQSSGQDLTISPFSDFLLHEVSNDGKEYRTAPLWGLGLTKKVNGSLNLLHDGSAESFDSAIKQHFGEASRSRKAYLKLTSNQKSQVELYLESL